MDRQELCPNCQCPLLGLTYGDGFDVDQVSQLLVIVHSSLPPLIQTDTTHTHCVNVDSFVYRSRPVSFKPNGAMGHDIKHGSVYLIRWGFINSVRTVPRMSFLPYSTKVSSPALNTMHTCSKTVWVFILFHTI